MGDMVFDPTTLLNELPAYLANSRVSSLLNSLRMFQSADNYLWMPYACPNQLNTVFAARASFEQQMTVVPGSFLTMITGMSDQAAGFSLQLYDEGAKRYVVSVYATDPLICGQGQAVTLFPPAPPWHGPYILPSPLPILHPGNLVAQFTNLAIVQANIQCCFFFASPINSAESERVS